MKKTKGWLHTNLVWSNGRPLLVPIRAVAAAAVAPSSLTSKYDLWRAEPMARPGFSEKSVRFAATSSNRSTTPTARSACNLVYAENKNKVVMKYKLGGFKGAW